MRKSRLSVYKQDRLIEHFVSGSTARTATILVGVNKSSAAYFYHRLREIIVFECEQERLDFFLMVRSKLMKVILEADARCAFHSNPATDSDLIRPPIPVKTATKNGPYFLR
jgi:hypothetical protein